ncbi:unnamed protein product [Brachionus calyciflorus]|uniref:Uncharacterized protein n=1 Tax=Brachionus calyciflorus TaxID=104777 RepID=A0A813LW16_9BILA|nr:unnamed protein product [Brachionus calyciflorus]
MENLTKEKKINFCILRNEKWEAAALNVKHENYLLYRQNNESNLFKEKTDNKKVKSLQINVGNILQLKKISRFKKEISPTQETRSNLINLVTTISSNKSSKITTTTPNITIPIFKEPENNNDYDYGDFDLYRYNYVDKYKPEVGLRTALVLGSMLLSIVLYIFWRNRRCLGKGGSRLSDDYDLEYWLQQVDKQKLAQSKQYFMSNPKLPEIVSDSKQSTAAWVHEHQKVWRNSKRTNYLNRNFEINNLEKLPKKFNVPINESSEMNFFGKIPFLNRKKNNVSKNEKFLMRQSTRRKSAYYEELDANTQLLINYARVDANDSKFEVVNSLGFNKFKRKSPSETANKHNQQILDETSTDYNKMMTNAYFINRRRRHSWPRCKADYSFYNSINKDLRKNFRLKEVNEKFEDKNSLLLNKSSSINKIKKNSKMQLDAAASMSLKTTRI